MSEKLRLELTQAVDDDAAAFEAVMGALRLPKDNPDQAQARAAAVHTATINAAHVPLHVAEHALKVMELSAKCLDHGNQNALSDSYSATALAKAALSAAGSNVRINLNSLEDKSTGKKMLIQLVDLEKQAAEIDKTVQTLMSEKMGSA
jgi:formiminotetrahydrofolate cyclodeaminase